MPKIRNAGVMETDAPAVADVRERILQVASALFYRHGARAVGVDLVVAEAGVAKTSLYRHFGGKDELVAAFLAREDEDFWRVWGQVANLHAQDPVAELDAHLQWIGERLGRPNYRGCPQLNVAAEFPEPEHPARRVAAAHKLEMRRRLQDIAERMGLPHASQFAGQLALIINGAFSSAQMLSAGEAVPLLQAAARALALVSPQARAEATRQAVATPVVAPNSSTPVQLRGQKTGGSS